MSGVEMYIAVPSNSRCRVYICQYPRTCSVSCRSVSLFPTYTAQPLPVTHEACLYKAVSVFCGDISCVLFLSQVIFVRTCTRHSLHPSRTTLAGVLYIAVRRSVHSGVCFCGGISWVLCVSHLHGTASTRHAQGSPASCT